MSLQHVVTQDYAIPAFTTARIGMNLKRYSDEQQINWALS